MKFDIYMKKLNPEIKEYFECICKNFPKFLIPFIESETMARLDNVSYFCGAYYGSKNVYDFKYDISRLDHSISTALLTWAYSFDETATLAALFHDATTPAFSHVIDYLNEDYINQESTELNLKEYITNNDPDLVELFNYSGVDIDKVSNFKNYSLVDLPRPKLCADRLDCIFLANLAWSKQTTIPEVKELLKDISIKINEDGQEEFCANNILVADRLVELNDNINTLTHTQSDFDSMMYLSKIVKRLIELDIIRYEDLFTLTDKYMFYLMEINMSDEVIWKNYVAFKSLKQNMDRCNAKIKDRCLNPLVKEIRYRNY